MYSIVIINSDNKEAKTLASMVGSDFLVEGIFAECQQALSFSKDKTIDLIIADASADKDGIARFLKKDSEVLVLCRYQDMEAAKKMSEIGVGFYLLKPVRFDEFSYALSSVKLNLDRRHISRLQNIDTLDFGQFIPILREQFFYAVANGKISSRQELREQAAKHCLEQSICGMPCAFTEVHITEYHNYITNKWKYGRETLYTAIKNLLADTDDFSFQLVKTTGSVMSFVVVPAKHISMKTLEESLRMYIIKSTRQAFELFGLLLFINNRKFFPSLFDMMEYTHHISPDSYKDPEHSDRIQRLISHIKMYRIEEAKAVITDPELIPEDCSSENAAGFLLNLLYIVCDALFSGDTLSEMRKKAEKTIIEQSSSPENLFRAVRDLVAEYAVFLKKTSRRSDDIVISKVKQYIRENCSGDISLGDAADFVYLSPVYFSRIFKQKTGENFSDYLLRVRMEKASNLLAGGGLKVNEVASAVGFKNTKYFSKLFKKYSGCSPREYSYMYLDASK